MKKKIVILLFILVSFNNFSQNATLLWANGTTGTSACEPRNFKVDASGNVFSIGIFYGTIDFDPGPSTFTIASTGASDIFVLKLDVNGNFVWAKSLGGTSSDYGYSIDTDAAGNVYTCGSFMSVADFDPGIGTFTLASTGSVDAFISKLDLNGNFLWAKKIGGTTADEANSIKVDAVGNVLNTGFYTNTVDFDPGPGTFTFNAVGTSNAYIQKLDGNGIFIWAKTFNSLTSSIGRSIILDGGANIYSTGTFDGTLDLDPSNVTFTVSSNGLEDFYISKLDANGNFVWGKSIGSSNTDFAHSLKTDGLGNIILTGFFEGLCDFDPGATTYTLNSFTSEHAFVLKLDASGNLVWAKNLGASTGNTRGNDIAIDATNNVYTTGSFSGSSDFDPGTNTYSLTSAGTGDVYITKLNASGNFLFADKIGNTGSEIGKSIHITTLNILYLSGYFQGTVDFDLGVGTSTLNSGSSIKSYYTKYCVNPTIPLNVTPSANQLLCVPGNSTSLMAISDGSVSWYSSPTSTLAIASGSVFNTSTLSLGSYTYYAEAANGCGLSTTRTAVSITVATSPIIVVNSGVICSGNTFTITPGGANTYTIQGGNAIVSPSISATYTVTGTNTVGCVSQNFATSSITVNPNPTIIAVSTSSLICSGETATLTASGATTFTWNTTATSSAIAVSSTITTTYTVNGTNANGCSNMTTITQSVSACAGLNNLSSMSQHSAFKVYPNPSTDNFEIVMDEEAELTITNGLGQVILERKLNAGKNNIDLSNYANGIYFINAISKTKNNYCKLIKQ